MAGRSRKPKTPEVPVKATSKPVVSQPTTPTDALAEARELAIKNHEASTKAAS